ncbi:MAG: hypothetical protein C0615_11800 [Desulfuromonas sp.]|nr:MAG: hypothetical protein C0615_11800 [Desulfuromonas sp.]
MLVQAHTEGMVEIESCKTVLIVEDEEVLLELLVHRFEKAGFKTISATNGPTACHLIGQKKPDVILLDILLPQLTGLVVLEMLRKHPTTNIASTPVIVVTAQVSQSIIRRSLQLGANAFHFKPYSIIELINTSHDLGNRHRETLTRISHQK